MKRIWIFLNKEDRTCSLIHRIEIWENLVGICYAMMKFNVRGCPSISQKLGSMKVHVYHYEKSCKLATCDRKCIETFIEWVKINHQLLQTSPPLLSKL